jgi:ubiquitin-conjugating enzyme (huntingtin interacting protein 2)
MASNRTRRITKELVDLKSDPQSNVEIEPLGDDLTHLTGTILGPPDTPYQGGKFKVDIKIPLEYPFRPPVMQFTTRVWHPNISSQTVCSRNYNLLNTNYTRVRYA